MLEGRPKIVKMGKKASLDALVMASNGYSVTFSRGDVSNFVYVSINNIPSGKQILELQLTLKQVTQIEQWLDNTREG